MKLITTIILGIFGILFFSIAYAQVPQLFNYQGIARDSKGEPLSNQIISLKLAILPTLDASISEYEETQSVTTNEFGLYSLQIGNGTAVTGTMKTVKWETGNKYIKVGIDANGGTNYVDVGINQLLTVPYAIYADKAGIATNTVSDKSRTGAVNSNATHVAGDANFVAKFTGLNTIGKSSIFDNGTSIGIGTVSPSALTKVHLFTGTGNVEHLRMQNIDSSGFGAFRMYNDVPANYATFTKYGSTYPGGYSGIVSQYPFANMLAFGNNNGSSIFSTSGNVGIAIIDNGVTKLKFNANKSSGYIGIGGNALPAAKIHFNTVTSSDTIKFTNSNTGHTSNDGFEIRTIGNGVQLINRENSTITLGTNNADRILIDATGKVGIGTNSPLTTLDINGQVRIQGGAPAVGKVLTSDANGLATWGNGVPGPQGPPGIGGFMHYVGEVFGGGVVFYVYRDNLGAEHGLIINLTDQSTSQQWIEPIPLSFVLIGPSAQSLWDGLTNSTAIVNQVGHTNSAAKLCLDLVSGGQSDWYLPSADELNLIYQNRFNVNKTLSVTIGATTIGQNLYWGSTETLDQTASVFYPTGSGVTINSTSKSNALYVRAIRAF